METQGDRLIGMGREKKRQSERGWMIFWLLVSQVFLNLGLGPRAHKVNSLHQNLESDKYTAEHRTSGPQRIE